MRWRVIVRRLVRQEKGTHHIELPGTFAGAVEAENRATALRLAQQQYQPARGRVEVVAECSWDLMTQAERDRLLDDFTPPDETKELRALRRAAVRQSYRAVRPRRAS